MDTRKLILILILFIAGGSIFSQTPPQLSEIDRIRLSEAIRLKEKFSERIWTNWGKIPLAILLITNENEFLSGHPKPSKDFTEIGYDKLLKSKVFWRKRQFDTGLLATFPAIEGSNISTIVVGQAENSEGRTSTPWVVTLLHEHFHQFQDSQPNIFQELNGLDLAAGNQNGMWMLNFPFPYKDQSLNEEFSKLSNQLSKTLETENEVLFRKELQNYLKMRIRFNESLREKDYKYLSFQLWKEGIARYTDYQIARLAGENYKPVNGFRKLRDFTPYSKFARMWLTKIVESLKTIRLDKLGREVVYPFGAAEGLLLDRARIDWKSRYFREKFFIDKFFEPPTGKVQGN